MGLIKREIQVSKRTGCDFRTRASGDLQWLFLSPESPLFCDACGARLSTWGIVRRAWRKPQGAPYIVPCRSCGCLNERVKGALADRFDERWEGLDEKDP